mmetsp:Transcript_15844/g.22660  ORF Transcript_15844/g.22660 Transcript_15844/m.22660 type:complete len:111 (-) Transcript_15844:137-469(-)
MFLVASSGLKVPMTLPLHDSCQRNLTDKRKLICTVFLTFLLQLINYLTREISSIIPPFSRQPLQQQLFQLVELEEYHLQSALDVHTLAAPLQRSCKKGAILNNGLHHFLG